MKFVDRPFQRPQRCAVIPYVGATYDTRWIDTGSNIGRDPFDDHIYVSEVAARELARLIGWCAPGERKLLEQRLADSEARVAELERELSDAEHALDAVHVLKAKGYSAQRKPGRKEAVHE